MLSRDALNQTQPIPPQEAQVTVLNANGQRKQATLIAEQLSDLGFAPGTEPGNDPAYPNYDLNCQGQIRFGTAGAGAARTLSLMVPCAQLVRDDRSDSTVQLALGARFDDIRSAPEGKQVLQQLRNGSVGTHASNRGAHREINPPQVDPQLLAAARDVQC